MRPASTTHTWIDTVEKVVTAGQIIYYISGRDHLCMCLHCTKGGTGRPNHRQYNWLVLLVYDMFGQYDWYIQ
jgi:hypothetical protein